MVDTALQRKNMVESQVRPSNVTDRRIMAAMTAVPRETYVPAAYRSMAYLDTAIEVDSERGLMAPRAFARLVQLATIPDQGRVLLVGAGLGYGAAVLARIAGQVVAIESNPRLATEARARLKADGVSNVSVIDGTLSDGAPADAPFDAIVIEGSIAAEPRKLFDQLGVGRRLVAVMVDAGVSRAICFENLAGRISRRVAFEANAPYLPGFEIARPAFQF